MQKTIKSFALSTVTLSCFFSSMPVLALTTDGSYKAIACSGATSLFEKAHGSDKNYDIGNTKLKSLLVNAGENQVAALQILYKYTPVAATEFGTYLINFRDDGQTRNNIKVHFCLRRKNGGILGLERNLTDFNIRTTPTGDWSFGIITAADLDLEPGDKANLEKVVFRLEQPGNIQFGNSRIGVRGSDQLTANTVDLSSVGPCTYINSCKDIDNTSR
ncbi:MAG: hypothetical protein JST89_17575 [Cyanobacteria bacterium SZAS-4]|nr:hypothetical protein [Cyanobacteria bacterium SZAS-4]